MTAWDYDDTPLTCPGCWRDIDDDWAMCSHDDDPGPVCPDCCRYHHPDDRRSAA